MCCMYPIVCSNKTSFNWKQFTLYNLPSKLLSSEEKLIACWLPDMLQSKPPDWLVTWSDQTSPPPPHLKVLKYRMHIYVHACSCRSGGMTKISKHSVWGNWVIQYKNVPFKLMYYWYYFPITLWHLVFILVYIPKGLFDNTSLWHSVHQHYVHFMLGHLTFSLWIK
jgi:hypothetical protein